MPAEPRRLIHPRLLFFLGALFLLGYQLFFTFDGFNTVFGGDDGMNLLSLHHHWEIPLRQVALQALRVVTPEYRPLGGLFYRPMFMIFGYDPLAFRIAIALIMLAAIWLVYLLARALEMPRSAAALCCLLFSYNAGTMDFQYNTGTIYDLLAFLFYVPALILYVRGRSSGRPLRLWEMALVLALFGAALDSKEIAVTLPGALFLYEAVYRRADIRTPRILARQGAFLAALSLLAVFYSRAKVTELSTNAFYRPRHSISFALGSYGHYFELLLYRKPESFTITTTILTMIVLVGLCLLIRSRAAIFGALFFVCALVPLAPINHRGGFAAYVAFPGLAIAAACLLDFAREALVSRLKLERYRQAIAIGLFLLVAYEAGRLHIRIRNRLLPYMHQVHHDQREVMTLMKQRLPDLPPDFRLLLVDNTFPPGDWILFFLTRMLYSDPTVWLDRPSCIQGLPDLPSYDLIIHYRPGRIDAVPFRFLGMRWKWEPRAREITSPVFILTSQRSDASVHPVTFSPATVAKGQSLTLTVPEIASTQIDVVYRLVTAGKEEVRRSMGWCALDAQSSCTVPAPARPGTLIMDWVRPQNGQWRRTVGSLAIH